MVESKSDKSDSHTRVLSREAERKEAKEKFIAFLHEDPTVSLACEHINKSRDTIYKWREKDQKFAKEWDDAIERAKDVARSSIYKRGIMGWMEPIVSMGQVVCEQQPLLDQDGNPQLDKRGKPIMVKGDPIMIRKWSDSLAMAYAKANLPEYKDKPQVNIHAQLDDLAQKAKDSLLADLAAAIGDEDKEPSDQS